MKDSKFIELLNLYVDHQISAADAALLETEIQKNPQRRQIYRQYCQMQKACSLLADNFRTEAPTTGKVIEFAPRQRRFAPVAYTIGALAAAACIALVATQRTNVQPTAPIASAATAAATTTVAQTSPSPAVAAPTTQSRVPLQPVFDGSMRGATIPLSLAASDNSRVQFDWMNAVQLTRVRVEELKFEQPSTYQPQDLTFRSHPASEMQTEPVAFRFQK